MKRFALIFLIAVALASVVSVGLGGFFSLTLGAVGSAVMPSSKAADIVGPHACPEGSRAAIEKQDGQCNEHNRNSGTCQTVAIDCYDAKGKLVKSVDPNSSLLLLFGLCVAYCFAVLGPLLFLITFGVVMIAGGGLVRALQRLRRQRASRSS